MSDQKKDPTKGVFPPSGAVRDAIPTSDEGDALLDMLFDDAPRGSDAPAPASAAPVAAPPAAPAPRPAPAPAAPRPAAAPGKVVNPPGWAGSRPSVPTYPEPDMEDVATRAFAAPPPDYDDLDSKPAISPNEPTPIPGEPAPAAGFPDVPLDDDDDLSGATIIAASVVPVRELNAARDSDVEATVSLDGPLDPAGRAESAAAPADDFDDDDGGGRTRAYQHGDPLEALSQRSIERVQQALSSEPEASEPEAFAPEFAAEIGVEEEAAEIAVDEPEDLGSRAPTSVARVSVRPAPVLDNEREASAALAESGMTNEVVARANWLREEAALCEDKLARSRLLLVVSELYAQAGEEAAALEVAQEAQKLAPNQPMAIRQARSLLARGGDWALASEHMEAEIRHMPTPEARAHSAWISSEIARIVQRDDVLAKRRSEQAARACPSDPRPNVQRFVELAVSLPEPVQLTKVRPSDPEILAPLASAFQMVAALRGLPPTKGQPAPRHVVEAGLLAQQALDSGDVAAIAANLGTLRQASFAPAAGWLAASVVAANDETRREALPALRDAAGGSAGALARRAHAAVSLELGESIDPRDPETFSPLDRVALATLDGARPDPHGRAARETLMSILDEAGAESTTTAEGPAVAQLTAAAVGGVALRSEQRSSRLRYAQVGAAAPRAAALLGRALAAVAQAGAPSAQSRETLDAAIGELVQTEVAPKPEWTALVRAIGLELDIDSGAGERVAQTIATWGTDGERAADASGMLAAALLAEISGQRERAQSMYAEVQREDPSCEAVARAAEDPSESPSLESRGAFARSLKEHAELLPPGVAKAVLFTECSVRLHRLAMEAAAQESPEAGAFGEDADACAKAAAELAPQLPIAVHMGELGARARADQEALLEWLRFRRESSDDPIEAAHDLTREALLISDGESNAASSLLEQALAARPGDFGLRDLYERLSAEPPADRAQWREARALDLSENPATRVEASRLAIEAALEYERTGDLDAAARCAKLAASLGETEIAPIAAYRFALAGFGTAELVDSLLPQARATDDVALRLETYERLAELDERGRNDAASGLLFRRTILEEHPGHVHTLRRVASALMAQGRDEELEPIAMELARHLEGGEATAYAALATRLRLRTNWEETAEPVAIAYSQTPRPIWALRQMAAHARHRGDHLLAAQCDQQLIALTDRPSERATLSLRAAQALRQTEGQGGESALALLEDAVRLVPEHAVARLELAKVLEEAQDHAGAAAQLEALSETLATEGWRKEIDLRAALLWQDHVGDADRARAALERVAAVDPNNVEVFERLRRIYVAAGARGELAELLARRLSAIEDPGERVEMEVMRGRALAEVGDQEAAKRALAAALDANPDHIEALGSFAELCFEDGDYEGAEQALIRLARLTAEPDRQVDIYFRLGKLYDELLPNDERAELAYQEILKRRPTDVEARDKLIRLYRRSNQFARAVEEQNALVNAAEAPEDKCLRTVELAEIMEEMGELKKAESTLVVARKSFPKSDLALRALVKFYQRSGQAPAAAVLLDRAVADARRALGTGRFETFLFETLATAAELRNRPDAANVATATVHAIEGQEVDLGGVGLRAGDAAFDELLAPEVMTPAFRELLLRTGPMLDAAFPYDLDGVRALPLPPPLAALGEEVRAVAGAYGLPQIQTLVSNVLGPICVPARAHPPTIVMGQTLASQDPSPERTFLLHRAMKVLQANAAVFARTAPIDLWPLLAAYLRAFNPQFTPQGVDAARFSEALGRLSRTIPPGLPQDTAVLAADVIGSIGNRASTLNAAINGWGSRAGLLAVGDPNVALTAIAWAGGNGNGPPAAGKDRLTWIGRNAEARDLIIFAVSDPYVDARSRLGA